MNAKIKKLSHRIVEQFHPEKVILFGSHATGKAHADSDVDLLVVLPRVERHAAQAAAIRVALPADVPIDIIVRTSAEISERLALGDFFIREITNHGIVLYEANHAGMD